MVGTSKCYLFGMFALQATIFLCFFYFSDPAGLYGVNSFVILKYLPLIFCVAALLFFLLTMYKVSFSFFHWLYLLLFLYISGGGFILYFYEDELLQDTFIGRALPMLALYIGPYILISSNRSIYDFVGRFSVLVSVLMTTLIIFWFLGFKPFNVPNIYHEEVFIFYVASIYSYFKYSKPVFLFVIFIALLGCIFSVKNTGFLVAVVIIAHLLFLEMKRKEFNFSRYFIVFFMFLSFCILIFFMSSFIVDMLPSGSPDVRLKTYEMRLNQFYDYPWFGTGFSSTPLIELETILGPIFIPSHSDLLDILAFGGIISVFVLVSPVVYVFLNLVFSSYISKINHLFSSCVFGVFITLMVNPILNQPHISVIYWLSLGIVLSNIKYWIKNQTNRESFNV